MWLGNSIQTKQLRDFVENMGTHSSAHLSPHSPRAKSSSFKPPFTIEIIIYYRISPLFIDDFPIQTRHLWFVHKQTPFLDDFPINKYIYRFYRWLSHSTKKYICMIEGSIQLRTRSHAFPPSPGTETLKVQRILVSSTWNSWNATVIGYHHPISINFYTVV